MNEELSHKFKTMNLQVTEWWQLRGKVCNHCGTRRYRFYVPDPFKLGARPIERGVVPCRQCGVLLTPELLDDGDKQKVKYTKSWRVSMSGKCPVCGRIHKLDALHNYWRFFYGLQTRPPGDRGGRYINAPTKRRVEELLGRRCLITDKQDSIKLHRILPYSLYGETSEHNLAPIDKNIPFSVGFEIPEHMKLKV
jgi:hypothetical protein